MGGEVSVAGEITTMSSTTDDVTWCQGGDPDWDGAQELSRRWERTECNGVWDLAGKG